MKTKTEAVKVLLEAGWSWDEVRGVLEDELNDISYISHPICPDIPDYVITCDAGESGKITVVDSSGIVRQYTNKD